MDERIKNIEKEISEIKDKIYKLNELYYGYLHNEDISRDTVIQNIIKDTIDKQMNEYLEKGKHPKHILLSKTAYDYFTTFLSDFSKIKTSTNNDYINRYSGLELIKINDIKEIYVNVVTKEDLL